MSVSFTELIVC